MPEAANGVRAVFVPDYSGGSAVDSHHLPLGPTSVGHRPSLPIHLSIPTVRAILTTDCSIVKPHFAESFNEFHAAPAARRETTTAQGL